MTATEALRFLGGIAAIGGGLGFCAIGVVGLLRMPDIYTRAHAAGKVVTMGASLVLLGVAILAGGPVAIKAVGTLAFLLLTLPLGTMAAARAAHRRASPLTSRTATDELARNEASGPGLLEDERP